VAGALNHLGVEVETSAEVGAAKLTGQGLATLTQDATSCCYAVQDKVWVHDPDGAPWEVCTVLADAPHATTTTTTTATTAGSGCATVDGQCVPVDATAATAGAVAREIELTTHGVPVDASAVRSCC